MGGVSGSLNNACFDSSLEHNNVPSIDGITYQGVFNSTFFNADYSKDFKNNILDIDLDGLDWKNPFSNQNERLLTIILKSKYDGVGYRRPIDLIFCLDKSGSMSSHLKGSNETCISLAKKSIISMLKILNPDDKVCLIAADNSANVIFDLISVEKLFEKGMDYIENSVNSIAANGGTDLQFGFKECLNQLKTNKDEINREKRIIFSTDLNSINDQAFLDMIKNATKDKIYTTILGIGTNLNVEFTEKINKLKGCNSLSALNENDFSSIMIKNFKHNFFPVANNIKISIQSRDFEFIEGIGTTVNKDIVVEDDKWDKSKHIYEKKDFYNKTQTLMLCLKRKKIKLGNYLLSNVFNFLRKKEKEVTTIPTFFSGEIISKNNSQMVLGGLILLRLKNISEKTNPSNILLKLSYNDINDNSYMHEYVFNMKNKVNSSYPFKSDNSEVLVEKQNIIQALALYSYVLLSKKLIYNFKLVDNNKIDNHYKWMNKSEEIEFFEKVNNQMKIIDEDSSKKNHSNICKLTEIVSNPKSN